MPLWAMKVSCIREPAVIGHKSGKDKNQNKFCFSTHLLYLCKQYELETADIE